MSAELVTINTEWLSDCSGCHIAIVDLHEKILAVLESVRIQRCPVLTDVKDYPPAKIGLVSGAIRNEHDKQAAIEMRKSCDRSLPGDPARCLAGRPVPVTCIAGKRLPMRST